MRNRQQSNVLAIPGTLAQQIVDSIAEGVLVCDTALRCRLFNRAMEARTGRRAEEVIGRNILEIFAGPRAARVEQLLKRALNGERVQAEDVPVTDQAADAHGAWECCTYAPHWDAEGNIAGVISLVRDVTEQHRAEEMFRSMVVGTASALGAEFFPSLVRHMASALGAHYAFVAECEDGKHARVLAFWKDNGFAPNFEFDVSGTPCEKVLRGETCYYPENLATVFPENEAIRASGSQSYLGVPMLDPSGQIIGHLVAGDDRPTRYDARQISAIQIFAARAAAELKRQRAERELEAALAQVHTLQQKLQAENVYLQEEIQTEHNFEEIVGRHPALVRVLQQVETMAVTGSTVLILGETGTGKELIARALHNRSQRKHRPLVKLNCGAIPTGLVESELFGHRKGAFTGALENRLGRFELADGGTLFLDEIGELPLEVQVKLLRVLQEQEFEPLGTSRTMHVDVRIIAASNRDLGRAVNGGQFRADLYFRLSVLPLTLPPLRQRRSDIPLLAAFFAERFSRQLGKPFNGVAQETMGVLSGYDWPGNVRELQNVIERAVILNRGPVVKLGGDFLSAASFPAAEAGGSPEEVSLDEIQRRHIGETLRKTAWVIEGPLGAAQILGLHPNTLRSRMKKLGFARGRV